MAKKFLEKKNMALGDDDYAAKADTTEERGWNPFKSIDLWTISDAKLEKYLNDETKRLKVFKDLERNKVDSRAAYAQLRIDHNTAEDTVRYQFLK
ncbi:hypothetical protein PHMEG_00038063, partial [Phytophthora megakarya]